MSVLSERGKTTLLVMYWIVVVIVGLMVIRELNKPQCYNVTTNGREIYCQLNQTT